MLAAWRGDKLGLQPSLTTLHLAHPHACHAEAVAYWEEDCTLPDWLAEDLKSAETVLQACMSGGGGGSGGGGSSSSSSSSSSSNSPLPSGVWYVTQCKPQHRIIRLEVLAYLAVDRTSAQGPTATLTKGGQTMLVRLWKQTSRQLKVRSAGG